MHRGLAGRESSSKARARRPRSLSEAALDLVSATHMLSPTASTPALAAPGASVSAAHVGSDGHEELMVSVHDEPDDQGQGLQAESHETEEGDEVVDGDEEEEDYDEEDDDDQEEEDEYDGGYLDDQENVYYDHHYDFPIHHHHHHHHHHHQSAYSQDLDDYLSDDQDMSEDTGAPLDSLVANLLDPDMDAESDSSDPGSEVEAASQSGGSGSESPFLGNGTAGYSQAQAAVSMALAFTAMAASQDVTPPPVPNPPALPLPFEQLTDADVQLFAAWFEGTHPVALSNPNPATVGPSNHGLIDFLHHWASQPRNSRSLDRRRFPWPARVNDLATSQVTRIRYDDLQGDRCDLQGIDWEALGVTRDDARERRSLTFNNYVNIPNSDRWDPNNPDTVCCPAEDFFRFKCLDIRRNINLSHFQLRNLLASTSRSRLFYPGINAVHQFNPTSGHGRAVMSLGDGPGSQISALDAGHGFLVAGSFHGEYMIRHLDSDPSSPYSGAACHEGTITENLSGITNHVRVHQARTSSAPRASFASNDKAFRVLDLATETFLSQENFDFPLNCTALSPDGRLRVMVGDSTDVLITAAESTLAGGAAGRRPDILHRLRGHRDFGFACDWGPDGYTVATACQDRTVKIWDARWFAQPVVTTLRSSMSGVRSLKFSPAGGGHPVLVAAEEADFVHVIDATTFETEQRIDVFSELGGVAFADGGRSLMVLCCDRTRGGIMQLERCGPAAWDVGCSLREEEREVGVFEIDLEDEEGLMQPDPRGARYRNISGRAAQTVDWPRSVFTERTRVPGSAARGRRGRAAAAGVDLEPF